MTRYELLYRLLTKKLGQRVGNFIASLLWPLYLFLRFFKVFFSDLQIYYEARIAPFLAVHIGWIFWPVYRFLKALNICFVVNISDVTGHIILESDNFFRKIKTGEASRDKRYVWLRKNTAISRACIRAYKHKFWFSMANSFIYNMLFPVIIRYKDITIDCGLSEKKWQLPDDLRYHRTKFGQVFWYLYRGDRIDSHYGQHAAYYKLRVKCKDYFPLLDTECIRPDKKLADFLKGKVTRLALLHIKTGCVNATAEPTDPQTYLPVLGYLSELGYQLVFVGREKIPREFLKYGVINYANSSIATFRYDIQLFRIADLAITGGSGIAYLADCLDKSYLFLNSWMLALLPPSEKCVIVPTTVQTLSNEFLSFSEQIKLYNSIPGDVAEVFPREFYKGRNASSDEILEGMKELMALKDRPSERTPLQRRFHNLTNGTPTFWSSARISEYFLRKHIKLLEDRVIKMSETI